MRSAERFLVPTLLALLVAQCLLSLRVTSATFDEPSYVSAGYAALTTGVDLNPAHFPLMKYLLAMPLFLVGSAEVEAIPHWLGPLTKQKCSPLPNATCSFGVRPTSKRSGDRNAASSRLADG